MNKKIKSQFIRNVLEDESARLMKNQGLEMRKVLHFNTYRLYNDRDIDISNSGMSGKLKFTHKAYQRFLDMKRRVKDPDTGKRKLRSHRIHNRFVMGHYNSIGDRLMYEFTQETIDNIKANWISNQNG